MQIRAVFGPDHAEAVPGQRAEEDRRRDLPHHAPSVACAPQTAEEEVFDHAPNVGRQQQGRGAGDMAFKGGCWHGSHGVFCSDVSAQI